MPKRRTKVPGTPASASHVRPVCSVCETAEHMRRDVEGKWFCLKCADDWLETYVEAKTGGKSLGGVELPALVKDVRKQSPSFRDVYLNRAFRRRLGKTGGK